MDCVSDGFCKEIINYKRIKKKSIDENENRENRILSRGKSGEHLDETKTICSIQGFSISGIYSGLELDQETLASPLRGGEIMVHIFFLETFTSFSKV